MNDHNISWVAPEYEHRGHSADWYWAMGIVSVSLAIAFIIVGNILPSIIIILGMGMLLVHAHHPPKTLECSLSRRGVTVGETNYPWETLESFWVLEGDENAKYPSEPRVLITSKKTFMPHITLPLNSEIISEVHQTLTHMLPEVPQNESLPIRLMRVIGF